MKPKPSQRTRAPQPAKARPQRADKGRGGALDIRAELSDARRSILHRQERDALAVLNANIEGGGAAAEQAREALQIRADLLELTVLKQARAIVALEESLQGESSRLDELAVSAGSAAAGRNDDPRHIDNLIARLEAIELWILRSAA